MCLRHAKTVCDQNAREKVLSSEISSVPVAAIAANVLGPKEPLRLKCKF